MMQFSYRHSRRERLLKVLKVKVILLPTQQVVLEINNISLSVNGLTWTYVITKNQGAKDLSHFILNFQNCGTRSATIDNIVCATVNGQPAVLENSQGNTGCDIASVTTNFVKFDNLPGASSYTIVFKTDVVYGNFVGTTAWLKAGTSCFAYPVLAPCCPM